MHSNTIATDTLSGTGAAPCSADPDLFFGGHTEREDGDMGGPTLEVMQRAARLSETARTACLLRCPLAQQRRCAKEALHQEIAYGVWAGVQLPGDLARKIPVLNAQREILRGIADGTIDPRTHPSNAPLLRAASDETVPAVAQLRPPRNPSSPALRTAATA
ncbi:WhiB family transcriptional regulator [Mycobacterium sp. AZCC_0083]|uniref:WhiB family transcriptional regulator n=1 Tax=Mycobacterium sp. AZCC_0083 TaxID=2735882 RepID=UPI00160A81FB|nr:WhiB family transcriptional regulator [Mycobacterium sp. AZCC_0083]MBB5163551.1 WhiB family redox-sensing transcriptional regulator [Mycobacterium sp. AZCC_0083]